MGRLPDKPVLKRPNLRGCDMNDSPRIEEINPDTFRGRIPKGADLCVWEKGKPDTALILYGFDEMGLFDAEFSNPVYGFIYDNDSAETVSEPIQYYSNNVQ